MGTEWSARTAQLREIWSSRLDFARIPIFAGYRFSDRFSIVSQYHIPILRSNASFDALFHYFVRLYGFTGFISHRRHLCPLTPGARGCLASVSRTHSLRRTICAAQRSSFVFSVFASITQDWYCRFQRLQCVSRTNRCCSPASRQASIASRVAVHSRQSLLPFMHCHIRICATHML